MKYINKNIQLYLALKKLQKKGKKYKIEDIRFIDSTELGLCCLAIKYIPQKNENE